MFATIARQTDNGMQITGSLPRRLLAPRALAGALIGALVLAVAVLAGPIAVNAGAASEPPVVASAASTGDVHGGAAAHRAVPPEGAIRTVRAVRVIPLFDVPADQTGFGR